MSHLKPYGSWENLRTDATRLWGRFVDVARPTSVPRIDVRYINQIELPVEEPLAHWLRLLPVAPPDSVLEDPAEFSMRTVHRHPTTGAIAVVNLVQPHRDPSGARVIVFDIDCLYDHLALDPNSSEIWERADQLREFKNDVFFASITEHTRGLFR